MRLAVETLEELDWCLDQLESLQVNLTVIMLISREAKTRRTTTTTIWTTSMTQIVSDPPKRV